MSDEIISRSVQLDTIEFEGGEGRTLHARLFRWDEPSEVSDGGGPRYLETWERGVFAQSIRRAQNMKRGWPLMYNHDVRGVPIGVVPMIHERDDGPWMTAKISRTALGNDMVELIKDGAIPGVSVNGRNIRSARGQGGHIRRMEVALSEISVTPFPSLVGADEMVLRAHSVNINVTMPEPTPKRDDLAAYLASLAEPDIERAFKDPSTGQRMKWAADGLALSDGSWPIPNRDYLRRAIQSFGRGNKSDSRIKAWIKKRARALGAENMIPEGW